ncbi:hypothetical protein D3C72_1858570 [compost metagenome]
MQGIRAQAPALERAGAEVLDQHVALRRKLAHHVLAFRSTQVEGDGLLVARLRFPPDRSPFVQQTPFAQRIASARRFDLDDFRAERRQHACCKRPCDQLSQLQYANACKRL